MGWISVKDEKPPKGDKDKPFIAYAVKTKSVFVAYGNEWGYFNLGGNGVSFSYWMPLPEPPKENNKQ